MERKHMSAFELYQTLQPGGLPASSAAKKRNLQVMMAKKKKRRENGVETTKAIPQASTKAKNKMRKKKLLSKLQPVEESTLNGVPEEEQCGITFGESLERFLVDLGKVNNSRERASKLFQWLIHPVPAKAFFRDTWESKPIIVKRNNPDYYKGLFSTKELDYILKNEDVRFGVNLDVTSYTNGKRTTHNPPGRALPYTVWDFYESGCSLRMLNPQAFSSTVWSFLSILQEKFGSMSGANVYLTPPGTQGFAPHYDDIEAFVVQLEGKKHWRVYNPRTEEEVLPVLSSPNFDQKEIGKPILEVVLEAGDLLYFPRGFIHQGDCLPDAHSLHITISSYQKNSWGDLLMKMVPAALEVAMEEDLEFRRGLPLDYLTYMGVQHSDKDDPRRAEFMSHIESLMKKLSSYAPVDASVDQKAKEFLHDCLPPAVTPGEFITTVEGAPSRWGDGGTVGVNAKFKSQTEVRLIRDGCARLCSEGETVHLYYTTENSRVYHKDELKSFEIKAEYTDAVEFLIHSYPKFVAVGNLPCDTAEDRIDLVELLFERGIIHTGKRLENVTKVGKPLECKCKPLPIP